MGKAGTIAEPASGAFRASVVLLIIIVWLASTAWARPLAVPDGRRYSSIALEMPRSGDWLTPTLDGLPYFHKPPLFYWTTAGSLAAFGIHEWPARLAAIAGGCAATLPGQPRGARPV